MTGHAVLLLPNQHVAADEIFLVELHEPAQASLERRVLRIEVVAVQGESHLEAEGVASAESGRSQPHTLPVFQEPSPQCSGIVGCDVELEAVFTRVASAADDGREARYRALGEPVVPDFIQVRVSQGDEDLLGPGALEREKGGFLGSVLELHLQVGRVAGEPIPVLVSARRVHHQHVPICHAVDEEVVENAATFETQGRVLALAHRQA